jgi:hypothetical protein
MVMTFSHSTGPVPVLFDTLVAGPSLLSYTFALVMVVGMGVLRQRLYKQMDDKSLSAMQRSSLFFAQSLLAYLLMLVAMTFNVGLFLAVIVGLTVGYHHYLQQQIDAEKGECCS